MNTSEEISIDEEYVLQNRSRTNSGLKHLPHWPAVNIEFQDLNYSVPDVKDDNNKLILRGISGSFKSSQLTAILGPSGAGKSTLLNVLAGYKCCSATGTITTNGKPRDLRIFRKMSRYIMQEDIYQKMLTVKEALKIAADLKLGKSLNDKEKYEVINEILELLRLTKAADTMGDRLSGGERKRLSIALELVNNPPVIFLDEPTTGLDDMCSSQCISLLQRIAHGGRTVICSIHTPSAKIFAMFDHVYILAAGQCVYQGHGSNIVPYIQSIGLNCPLTYNPADFIIEVASGEYGNEHNEKMVISVDNGRCLKWNPEGNAESQLEESEYVPEQFEEEINPKHLKSKTSAWQQFVILHKRMVIQIFRNRSYVILQLYMHIFLGFIIGALFYQMGNDASKTLFNFGFCFTVIIAFMYIPMMPVLLEFPMEVQLLKREFFNRWYRLNPYYFALILAKLPLQFGLSLIYLTMIYALTDQPLEVSRILMFVVIAMLIGLTSESFGMLVASRLSIVNSMFLGPSITVPVMLLAVYGIGDGKGDIPLFVRALMSVSYLRYGLEGIIAAIYGYDRADMICPEEEIFCPYKKPKFLMVQMGFENVNFYVSAIALIIFYLVFNCGAYMMIRRRLSQSNRSNAAVQYIGRLVKTHFNFSSYGN